MEKQSKGPQAVGKLQEWLVDLPEIGKITLITAQLLLIVLIIRLFNIQDAAFQNLSVLILLAFLINAFLPQRYRASFFTLFSVLSVPLIVGPSNGAWVLGIGALIIGTSLLPVAYAVRVGLIVLIAAVLVAMRLEWLQAPWESSVWQLLGAMFMFRLIIYLYDIKHEKRRPQLKQVLSYFFMVPNVCFPLFPVVDYKKFQRSHYSAPACEIYQRGVSWMFRGVLHLLAYRFVYQYLTLDPVEVNGIVGLVHFSFSAFGLYLQVSGLFHLIVGILLLFGFNLPETNHLYFFASSFNDFWRRINIYWKDFMMKVFYYPVYFKLRKLGETWAIVLSTVIVFFATWFLHAYQWFWLRGTFLLEWHDALYWAVLAVLVIINSLYESKYGRERSLGKHSRSGWDRASLGFSTAGTFLTLGLLWGMWSSDSLTQWLSMWTTTGWGWLGTVVLIPTLFVISWGLGYIARLRRSETPQSKARIPATAQGIGFWRPALVSSLGVGVIYVLGHNAVYSKLPDQAVNIAESFRVMGLSKRDQRNLERGYYENLVTVNRNSQLWELYDQQPEDWRLPAIDGVKVAREKVFLSRDDFVEHELAPNMEFEYKTAMVSTNRWGMRDKDYTLNKPDNTLRIALLGASHVVGSGVNDHETFESILEERLNKEFGGNPHFEILNFAHTGRTVIRQVALLETKVAAFEPDIVFYVGHKNDDQRVANDLARVARNYSETPYAALNAIMERAELDKSWEIATLKRALYPFAGDAIMWAYQRIVSYCRAHKMLPVYIFLPMTYERFTQDDIREDLSMAQRAGFYTIDLRKVYNGFAPQSLYVAVWDKHPNAKANRLVADHLFEYISNDKTGLLAKIKNGGDGTFGFSWVVSEK